jgi:hypothetical protein
MPLGDPRLDRNMKPLLTFTFLLVAGASTAALAQSPEAVAKAFYQFDRSHSQTFNRRYIDTRRQWFSKELNNLFLYELKREAAYLKKNPGDKPYFDGSPFLPIDEVCKAGRQNLHRTFVIKPADMMADRAVVTATFPFPKSCKDTDAPTYTIGLTKQAGRWVIDDVNYGEDRTLKQDLNRKDY